MTAPRKGLPSLPVILALQAPSAVSELFGQRVSRRGHRGDTLRFLVSSSLWTGAQATLVLGALQLLAPGVCDSQGPFSFPARVVAFPALLLNPVLNAVILLAVLWLLRQPLGGLLVVLAFVGSSFLISPLQGAAGLEIAGVAAVTPSLGTLTLAVLGCGLCTWEPSPVAAAALQEAVKKVGCGRGSRQAAAAGGYPPVQAVAEDAAAAAARRRRRAATAAAFVVLAAASACGIVLTNYAAVAGLNSYGYTAFDQCLMPIGALPLAWALWRWPPAAAALELGSSSSGSAGDAREDGQQRDTPSFWRDVVAVAWREVWAPPPPPPPVLPPPAKEKQREEDGGASATESAGASGPHDASLGEAAAAADGAAAASTGASRGGDVEEPLPPADAETAPLVAAPPSSAPASTTAPASPSASYALAWDLGAFNGLEFCRTLAFFWAMNSFDTEATYLSMTLVRVVLSWGSSLLACTVGAAWVGISPAEAAAARAPLSLGLRLGGTVALLGGLAILSSDAAAAAAAGAATSSGERLL